ncbi:MAG: HAD family hydrolase [Bacilli bacterium]|nr:HAD family hydrolase [Bacilli bacterium]
MNTFLFDLDGTLLPLREDEFIDIYFSGLIKRIVNANYSDKQFTKALWTGINAMRLNSGEKTNEEAFWSVFSEKMNCDRALLEAIFLEYYKTDFVETKNSTAPTPYAALCINVLKEKGYRLALATNPLFPQIATYQRIKWAGLNPNDFLLVTTIENSFYCKPNLKYYEWVLNTIGAKPEECIMVGNDIGEDMVAAHLGMRVYLLTECLINSKDENISLFEHGRITDLYQYILALPKKLKISNK